MSKVEQDAASTGASSQEEDPTTKDFQEKYYPIGPAGINKYDIYTLKSTIDTEIT